MRYLILSIVLFVPVPFANSQDVARNPFGVSEDNDDIPSTSVRNPQHGSITFAFDGGTLLCTFGRRDRDDKSCAAMILVPTTARKQIERKILTPPDGQQGSIVIFLEPDGKKTQINRDNVYDWAKARVADIASRESAVAEHAFVATVVHTISTGTPLSVWGSDAQDTLESGQWCKLFAVPNAIPSP